MLKAGVEVISGGDLGIEADLGEEMNSVTCHFRGVRSHRYTLIVACSLRDARLTLQL
jgi:hypothetical protein